jgi:hypothetical protein
VIKQESYLIESKNTVENAIEIRSNPSGVQVKASSEPIENANESESGKSKSESNESVSESDLFSNADYYGTDYDLDNIAGSSVKILMLRNTVAINNGKVYVCYDSSSAFTVIHESIAAPMNISEYSACGIVPASGGPMHKEKNLFLSFYINFEIDFLY